MILGEGAIPQAQTLAGVSNCYRRPPIHAARGVCGTERGAVGRPHHAKLLASDRATRRRLQDRRNAWRCGAPGGGTARPETHRIRRPVRQGYRRSDSRLWAVECIDVTLDRRAVARAGAAAAPAGAAPPKGPCAEDRCHLRRQCTVYRHHISIGGPGRRSDGGSLKNFILRCPL